MKPWMRTVLAGVLIAGTGLMGPIFAAEPVAEGDPVEPPPDVSGGVKAEAPATVTEAQIDGWIQALSDEDGPTRMAAREQLIGAGGRVKDRLEQELAKKDLDAETRIGIKMLLAALPRKELETIFNQGTPVELDLQNATLKQALAAIAKQTGAGFEGVAQQFPGRKKQSIQFRGSYWQAMRKIAFAYQLSSLPPPPAPKNEEEDEEDPGDGALEEYSDEYRRYHQPYFRDSNSPYCYGYEPVQVAGPFCLRMSEIALSRNLSIGEDRIEIELESVCEPMLQLKKCNIALESMIINGKPVTEFANDFNYNRDGGQRFAVACPKGAIKSLAVVGTIVAELTDLRGRQEVVLGTDIGKTFSFAHVTVKYQGALVDMGPDLAKRIADSRRHYGNYGLATAGLLFTWEDEQGANVLNEIRSYMQVMNDKGKIQNLNHLNNFNDQSMQGGNGRGVSERLGMEIGFPPSCTKLVIRYPLLSKQVTIPFKFEKLPLPVHSDAAPDPALAPQPLRAAGGE